MSLAAQKLQNGRFVYLNPDYVEQIYPAGEDYSDVYMASGQVISVEGDEHVVKAIFDEQALSEEGWEEEDEDDSDSG